MSIRAWRPTRQSLTFSLATTSRGSTCRFSTFYRLYNSETKSGNVNPAGTVRRTYTKSQSTKVLRSTGPPTPRPVPIENALTHLTSKSRIVKAFEASGSLRISDEVKTALGEGRPVVALESTIYTHGLPYPDNIALAIELENILRKNGVVPATIGFLDGVTVVGLSSAELAELGSSAGNPDTMKISRRDIPYIVGMGLVGKKINGGTTVAATMYLAEMCGIKVFATGGIGGVHRGGEDTLDISADLNEFGRTSMCVIASGCKSFLDIPRTLEYLETQGATVATYSDKNEQKMPFPAFYTRDSGVPSPLVITSPAEAASIIHAQRLLGKDFRSGFLLANPIPEAFAVPKASIDAAIEAAVTEASKQGIRGHANTPFILAHIKEVTKGKSVVANRALIKSNVELAAEVSKAYATILPPKKSRTEAFDTNNAQVLNSSVQKNTSTASPLQSSSQLPLANVDVLVYGALAVDLSCDYAPSTEAAANGTGLVTPKMHTSNPASITSTLGGVGHNVALAIHRAGAGKLNVRLCSFVADDFAGKVAVDGLKQEGLDSRSIQVKSVIEKSSQPGSSQRTNHTAQYVAFNDGKKDLVMAMADMAILDGRVYPSRNEQADREQLNTAKWAVFDGNLDPKALYYNMRECRNANTKVLFEPVSTYKSTRLFQFSPEGPDIKAFPNHIVDIATPNQYELAAMHADASQRGLFESPIWWETIDSMGIPSSGARDRFVQITTAEMTDEGIPIQTIQLLPFIPTILTKLGSRGVLHTELLHPNDPRLTDPASSKYVLSRTANEGSTVGGVYMRLYSPVEVVEEVVSVNGVGDTFVGVLVAGLASGMPLDSRLITVAQKGAVKTLRSVQAVSSDLNGILAEKSEQEIMDAQYGINNRSTN